MQTNNILTVSEIQRFCMHDGDGVRTAVFLKGCPLRCKWCHNPETKSRTPELMFYRTKCISCASCASVCTRGAQLFDPERTVDRDACTACGECVTVCPTSALAISGRDMTVSEIMREVKKDIPFYGDGGGVTVSGGEPTFQPDGLVSLLAAAKAEGIGTCIETCGIFPRSFAEVLAPLVDLFLFDIKDTDEKRLLENTGAHLKEVLDNLRLLDSMGAETVLRCILVPGVNMESTHYDTLCEIFSSLHHARYIEFLPYHPYGGSKAESIGVSDTVYDVPEREAVLSAAGYVKEKSVPVKIYGTLI